MNEALLFPRPIAIPKTAVLCHFETASGNVAIDDVGNVLTTRGTVEFQTGMSPTGRALFVGTQNSGIRIPATAFKPGDGDFTIESKVYYSDKQCLLLNNVEGASTGSTCVRFTNTRDLSVIIAGVPVPITNPAVSPTGWHHIAVVRHNGIVKVYIDGVLRNGTGTAVAAALPEQLYYMGYVPNNTSYAWHDEFRLSHVARYTANFTPQSTPFVVD